MKGKRGKEVLEMGENACNSGQGQPLLFSVP